MLYTLRKQFSVSFPPTIQHAKKDDFVHVKVKKILEGIFYHDKKMTNSCMCNINFKMCIFLHQAIYVQEIHVLQHCGQKPN